ncbi:MAG: trypsin-like peptidase domain-containing protein [Dorea sp.]|nr:trypsin-like peptidase domain-containing protein [Dorea sp.]
MKKMNLKSIGILATSIALAGIGGATTMALDNDIVLETNAPENLDQANYLPNVKGITQKVMPSIVAITAESKETIQFWGRRYEQDSEKAGSGVIIARTEDELIIATNNHVVEDANDLTVLFSVDVEDEKDALVPALVKGTDSSIDLAVVSVKIADIPKDVLDQIAVVEIGDSSAIDVGDWSIAIGNALGYGQSVTFGIISALDREVTLSSNNGVIKNSMLQTDAAINFGNSGGALLNADGQLIGINSAKASSSGVEGMGYAIPINTAKPILEDLMNQTTRMKVDTEKAGSMGINVTDVSEEARQLYNIPAGAYVLNVNDNSAAEKAGLEQGDIITKLDRTTISSVNELLARMEYYEAGEDVDVTVQRPAGNSYSEEVITITLDEKIADSSSDKASEKSNKKHSNKKNDEDINDDSDSDSNEYDEYFEDYDNYDDEDEFFDEEYDDYDDYTGFDFYNFDNFYNFF